MSMDIWLLILPLAFILLGLILMVVHRPRNELRYQYLGVCSAVVFVGTITLLRDYNIISSVVGWIFVAAAVILSWALIYQMSFRKKL